MRLTLADELAILYTETGSQREVARRVGLSHQQVGRILHAQAQGRPQPRIVGLDESRIRQALKDQAQRAARIAREEHMPEIKGLPVIARRLVMKNQAVFDNETGRQIFTGTPAEVGRYLKGQRIIRRDQFGDITKIITPDLSKLKNYERMELMGDRVGIEHMHWLRDELREQILIKLAASKQFYSVTIGSRVNLKIYLKRAELEEKRGLNLRSVENRQHKRELTKKLKEGSRYQTIYTPKRPMQGWPGETISDSLNFDLDRKHAPATKLEDKETKLADQMILQLHPDRENALLRDIRRQNRELARRNKARSASKK